MYLQGKGRGREEPNFGFHGTPAPPDPRPTGLGVRDLAAGAVSPGQQSSRAAPARRGAWVAAPSAAPGRVPQPAGRPPSSRLSQAFFLGGGPGRGSQQTLEDREDERDPAPRPTRRGSPGRSAARAGPRQTIQNTFTARRRGNARPLLGDRSTVVNRERGVTHQAGGRGGRGESAGTRLGSGTATAVGRRGEQEGKGRRRHTRNGNAAAQPCQLAAALCPLERPLALGLRPAPPRGPQESRAPVGPEGSVTRA